MEIREPCLEKKRFFPFFMDLWMGLCLKDLLNQRKLFPNPPVGNPLVGKISPIVKKRAYPQRARPLKTGIT